MRFEEAATQPSQTFEAQYRWVNPRRDSSRLAGGGRVGSAPPEKPPPRGGPSGSPAAPPRLPFTPAGAASPPQNDLNHAAGARLLYHLFDDRVSLGASLLDFEFREPEQQYRLIGVDFGWSTRYADLSGEAVYRTRRNTGSVDERGGFVQAVIPLRPRLSLVGRYERYKTAVIAQTTTINTLGVNYRLRPTVSFKVEYRYGSHNALVAPDGWLASFAVLF